MKQPTPAQVKTAYRRAIAKHFSLKQKDIKCDIHLGSESPGQWSPHSVLEIYCEREIPNATDYHNLHFYRVDRYYCHAEQWQQIDEKVNNLLVSRFGRDVQKYYHEPYNDAVVTIWPQ